MELAKRLKAYKGSIRALAKMAGVSHTTVRRLRDGGARNPGINTVAAIEGALDAMVGPARARKGRRTKKRKTNSLTHLGGGSRRTRESRPAVVQSSVLASETQPAAGVVTAAGCTDTSEVRS